MTEKIPAKILRDDITDFAAQSFMGALILESLASMKDELAGEIFSTIQRADENNEDIEICFKVAGHQIPCRPFFKNLQQQFNRIVQEEAIRLSESKLPNLSETLAEIERVTKQVFREQVRKAWPDYRFDDEE